MNTKRNTLTRELRKCLSANAASGIKQRTRALSNNIKEGNQVLEKSYSTILPPPPPHLPLPGHSLRRQWDNHLHIQYHSNQMTPTVSGKANTLNFFILEMGRPRPQSPPSQKFIDWTNLRSNTSSIAQTEVKNENKTEQQKVWL